jgi:hypothetical protein
MAQAGGKSPEKLAMGLDQVPALVQERLRQPSWRPSRGRASGDDDAHGLFRLLLRH